jgi:arginine/lysine/ornithine decarboxylase
MLHMAGDLVDVDKVSQCLHGLQSPSPSYLLLSSLDAARADLSSNANIFDETLAIALKATDQLRKIPGISVLDLTCFSSGFPAIDALRITFSASDLHLSGYEADDILHEDYHIVSELVGTQAVTLAANLGTRMQDAQKLVKCAEHLSERYFSANSSKLIKGNCSCGPLEKIYVHPTPRDAFFTKKRRVRIEDSFGKICGELICPYHPPGIPGLIPGEVVSETKASESVELLMLISVPLWHVTCNDCCCFKRLCSTERERRKACRSI